VFPFHPILESQHRRPELEIQTAGNSNITMACQGVANSTCCSRRTGTCPRHRHNCRGSAASLEFHGS
jgi:hypothetical protein